MLGSSPHNPYPMPLDPKVCILKNIIRNPNIIVGGHPVTLIRYRFDEQLIERRLHIRGWEWDAEKIARNVKLICSGNIDALEKAV